MITSHTAFQPKAVSPPEWENLSMNRRMPLLAVVLGLACLAGQPARADVKTPSFISDGMVLQRDMKVPIWGTADDGEQVTVSFQNRETSTTAKDGKWLVRLDDLKTAGPYTLTITGKNKPQLKQGLLGAVWI